MDALRILAEYRTSFLDALFQSTTYIAQETLVIVIICWLYWCVNKNLAYKLGFTYFISGLFIQGLKVTFRIPRPWILDSQFQPVASAVPAATGYSFPSGHTQSGTALFSTLSFYFKKIWIKILCIFIFLVIGFSRLYLGVHTPKDVLVSMIVTLIASAFVYQLFTTFETDHSKDLIISILLATVVFLLIGYASFLLYTQRLELTYARDCFKAGGAGLGFSAGFFWERSYINFIPPLSFKEKCFRFLIGIMVLVLLLTGLKPLLGESAIGCIIRYFLLVLWILGLYPYLFNKFKRP